jgi:hypothetical protein
MKSNIFFVHEYEYRYEHRISNIESVSIRHARKGDIDH